MQSQTAANPKKGPRPPTHAQLIDSLGGTTNVRNLLNTKLDKTLTCHAISMMKNRNSVPHEYRPVLAAEAQRIGKPLPANFLPGVS